jgi:hypothetical protein
MPMKGDKVVTPDGKAMVVDTTILREAVKVRLIIDEKSNELSEDILTFKKNEIKIIGSKKKFKKNKDDQKKQMADAGVSEADLKKLED